MLRLNNLNEESATPTVLSVRCWLHVFAWVPACNVQPYHLLAAWIGIPIAGLALAAYAAAGRSLLTALQNSNRFHGAAGLRRTCTLPQL